MSDNNTALLSKGMVLGLFVADNAGMRFKRGKNTTWFWRGVFVAIVAHSWMAVGDLKLETLPVWSESSEVVELADMPLTDVRPALAEFELDDNSPHLAMNTPELVSDKAQSVEHVSEHSTEHVSEHSTEHVSEHSTEHVSEHSTEHASERSTEHASERSTDWSAESSADSIQLSDVPVEFPSDVPMSEVLRVSKTFQGLIQENLRSGPYVLAERFAGSLNGDTAETGVISELETEPIDESVAELGFIVGQDVYDTVETTGLDPFKTYTVVNGRIRAVSPPTIARQTAVMPVESVEQQSSETTLEPTPQVSAATHRVLDSNSGVDRRAEDSAEVAASGDQPISLSEEEIERGLSEVTPPAGLASLDVSAVSAEFVTVSGLVRVPEGFARDKVVLRLAGTAFQVQTDAAGQFELRDVPKGTRFELLVWHLDGGLTRRLIPVAASGRDGALDIELVTTSYVDALAKSFGLVQQMNLGGFCARVDVENPAVLVGASVHAHTVQKNLAAHYFSDQGLPSSSQTELTPDGRFCVFNVDEPLVDVKLLTLNGTRRQFVVHVEPSTFEHNLTLDAAQSIYRKVSLVEPLDTREVIELSGRGVQPDFGDKRLRNWIFGEDTPVWTRVSNYVLRADAAYAAVRPNPEDLQFFPGGQKFIEVRVAPNLPDAPWGRVLLSRDDLMTESMLARASESGGRVYQDRNTPVSFPALDADAWDDIASDNHNLPAISRSEFGGLYLSIDATALGRGTDELDVSLRDTWTGESVCEMHRINSSSSVKSSRFYRAACGAKNGQFALIVQSEDGALLWSDVVRIRKGTVQTVTVMDSNF